MGRLVTVDELKQALIDEGHEVAIPLLELIEKSDPEGLHKWLNNGSTIMMRELSYQFKDHPMYEDREGPLPFNNDQHKLDNTHLHILLDEFAEFSADIKPGEFGEYFGEFMQVRKIDN